MRYVLTAILILLLPTIALSWSGEVMSVHDGDTLKVRKADGKIVTVRIYGVDCPELGQPYGVEAREMTARAVLGKTVDVIPAQSHKSYKREVSGIIRPDALVVLQEVLVSLGLAWVDDRYCKMEVCRLWRLHQKDAKNADPPRGLWSDLENMPPWQWRREQKGK